MSSLSVALESAPPNTPISPARTPSQQASPVVTNGATNPGSPNQQESQPSSAAPHSSAVLSSPLRNGGTRGTTGMSMGTKSPRTGSPLRVEAVSESMESLEDFHSPMEMKSPWSSSEQVIIQDTSELLDSVKDGFMQTDTPVIEKREEEYETQDQQEQTSPMLKSPGSLAYERRHSRATSFSSDYSDDYYNRRPSSDPSHNFPYPDFKSLLTVGAAVNYLVIPFLQGAFYGLGEISAKVLIGKYWLTSGGLAPLALSSTPSSSSSSNTKSMGSAAAVVAASSVLELESPFLQHWREMWTADSGIDSSISRTGISHGLKEVLYF